MLPRANRKLENFIQTWCGIKNDFYGGEAGLQFSINSTDEQRRELFDNKSHSLATISEMASRLPMPNVEFPSYCTDYPRRKGVI